MLKRKIRAMVALLRKINYRNITLNQHTQGETVLVRLKNGGLREVIWLGLIDRREVLEKLKGGNVRPVKIKVHSFRVSGLNKWSLLQENQFVQGCLEVGSGVRAVISEGKPRIVG